MKFRTIKFWKRMFINPSKIEKVVENRMLR